MSELFLRLTYVGGPTALLELGGLRLLTDPTFDPAGEEYRTPAYNLRKTHAPAIAAEAIGPIDVVLLSHDHHFDNLDHAGRALLARAGKVVTTRAGAARLGGNSTGLEPWESLELPAPDGRALRITATPARHGPAGGDRGPVIGFVLRRADAPQRAVYVSGDTVWYEGVAEIARRFPVEVAVLFAGAARLYAIGPRHLTFTAGETVEAARAFAGAAIVPLHFEGWEHLSESRREIEAAFAEAGLSHRLRWPTAGRVLELSLRSPQESAVLARYAAMLDDWNRRDARAFGGHFTEDGHTVGFDGSMLDGRDAIIAELERVFAGHPTAAYVARVRDVAFPAGGVAVLRAVVGMVPPGQDDLNPALNAVQTAVLTRSNEEWRIALLQNTPAAFHGRPEAVERLSEELREVLRAKRRVTAGRG